MLKVSEEIACIFDVSVEILILNVPVEGTLMLLNIAFPPIAFTVLAPSSDNPEK